MDDEHPDDQPADEPVDEEPDSSEQEDAADEQEPVDEQMDDKDTGEEEQTTGDEQAADDAVDGAATEAAPEGLVGRIRSFSADDWLVVVLGVMLIGVAVAAYAPFGGLFDGSAADDELVQFCGKTAQEVQDKSELPQGTTCNCLPPGQFNEEQFQTDVPEVNNATDVFLVQCTLPSDQTVYFPVRRLKPGYNATGQNGSLPSNNATIVE